MLKAARKIQIKVEDNGNAYKKISATRSFNNSSQKNKKDKETASGLSLKL